MSPTDTVVLELAASLPSTTRSKTPSKSTDVVPSARSSVSATPGICPTRTGSPDFGLAGWVHTSDSWRPLAKILFLAMSGLLHGTAERLRAGLVGCLADGLAVRGLGGGAGGAAEAAHPAGAAGLRDRRGRLVDGRGERLL